MKLRLGADPELFLVDAAGALIASCGLIGGTKAEPLPLDIGDGFAVQEDNVALEYNIPASESKEQFTNNIGRAMSYLSDMVATKGLAFSKLSAALFPEDQLYHPLAQEFGCDPDFNAWKKGATNPRPKADDHTLRTCGGHVHYGMIPNDLSKKDVLQFIKHVDLFLGVPSVLLDNGELRKQLYGKAGAFRFKRYGCEYRSLSNFWVLDPKLTAWVWDASAMAADVWQNNTINIDDLGDDIQNVINNNDKQGARNLVDTFGMVMV
jgi:hypothetical protein